VADTPSDAPVQPSLRRLREFAIRPDRELGQNFLVDSNILGVIERAAELSSGDVVLEVGGGLGVLSEHLAERARHVHVIELDEHLRDALLDATSPHANVSVHWGDAMQLDLAALAPSPTKLVANLPYNIAAGLILRTIELFPAMTRWVAMVQREVGERFAAQPGTSAYGVPSVLAQLACEVRVLRTVSRSVFVPVPNVDSVLVQLVRRDGNGDGNGEGNGEGEGAAVSHAAVSQGVSQGLRALVRDAFAHRRKTLAGSLALVDAAAGAGAGVSAGADAGAALRSRERVRAALVELGKPADVRAERLSPGDFRALSKALGL
jgi:16S rRNA (adenine1518-N6/adenine1519-N6)-dimethyltransferase